MPDFDAIRKKISLLKKYDASFSVFGATEHQYEIYPALTEPDINAFEKQEQIILPESYRDYLKYLGDGGAGPAYGIYPLEEARNGAGWYPPIDDLNNKPGDDDAPGELLISHNGCRLFTWLKITDSPAGEIWYDRRANNEEPECIAKDFLEWYEGWLDSVFFENGFMAHLGHEALELGQKGLFKESIELFKLGMNIEYKDYYSVCPEVKTEYLKMYCNVLYFLQNDNTGLPVNDELNHFFLKKALPYAEENPAIYFNAACLYNEMGDFKNVVRCIELAKLQYNDFDIMMEAIKNESVFLEFRKDPLFLNL